MMVSKSRNLEISINLGVRKDSMVLKYCTWFLKDVEELFKEKKTEENTLGRNICVKNLLEWKDFEIVKSVKVKMDGQVDISDIWWWCPKYNN